MVLSLKRILAWFFLFAVSICMLQGGVKDVWQNSADSEILLPVLMYHHFLKDSNALGKFVISPNEFEEDLKYLKEQGYQTVVAQDLTRYVNKEADLPEKPIMITLDDGYLSAKEYVLPLLQKYQMQAVLSVIGTYSDEYTHTPDRNVAYAHLTWDDIQELSKSGAFEIQNHTYNMHKNGNGRKGSMKNPGEGREQYQKILLEDLTKTQQRIETSTGEKAICFTYPFGFISKESIPILQQMQFKLTLTCSEGVNKITRDPDCLFGLKRYNRPHGESAQDILAKMNLN